MHDAAHRRGRLALISAMLGWLLACASVLVAARAGLRLNTSPSVPRGFYWLSEAAPVVGGYVAVCPPRSALFEQARARGYLSGGTCPGDFVPMIKVLAAASGDSIRIDADGVRVGGTLWPSSAPLRVDASGWALPQLAGLQSTLGRRAVLVMSQKCPLGFDSRYFGPLPSSAITARAAPLLTW